MVLYSLALAASLLIAAPWWLFRMATTQRYREGFTERLGSVPPALRALLKGKRTVWVHAVSVGEVLAVSTVVSALQQRLGPGWEVVISTTTRTGQQLARKRFPQSGVFYFPLDFRFAVRAWLQSLKPAMVLLVESEVWPCLLHECALSGVPVVVINARVSDRSLRRGLRLNKLWRWLTRNVTLWLAQSDADAARLVQLGAPAEKVETTGNLKYDTTAPEETALVSTIRRGIAGRPVIVAGSTVHYGTTPEEVIVLDAMRAKVWPEWPDVLLILASRHPQRFAEACTLASQFGTVLEATKLLEREESSGRPAVIQEKILVLDTIGDLAAVYALADIAFVGGSLLPHGGHNPLEPAQFGVPVVMGPHVQNFRDILARLKADEGIVLLESTEPGPLGEALASLLADRTQAQAIGKRGRAVFEQQKGATARTMAALLPLLKLDTQSTLGAPLIAQSHRAMRGPAPLARPDDMQDSPDEEASR